MKKLKLIPMAFMLLLLTGAGFFYLQFPYLDLPQEESHTTILIEKLQALERLEVMQSQLVSYKTYERYSWMGLNQDEFIMLVRGEAIYGIELSKIQITDGQEVLLIELPPIQVLQVNILPQSIEYIGLSKGWFTTQNRFENMKRQALIELHRDLKKQAQNKGFKTQAEKNARQILEQLLDNLGIKKYQFVVNPRKH